MTARVIVAGGIEAEVRTSDISEGGLGIVAPVNPRNGAKFRIRFGLPSDMREPTMIDTQVTVVRSILAGDEGGFKIGLLFAALDESSLAAIRKFINRGRLPVQSETQGQWGEGENW